MRLRISPDRIRELLRADPLGLPQYTSQLINLANQNAQGTRPKVVGQMSDLVQQFDGRSIEEWEKWYIDNHGGKIEIATDKIWSMIEKLKTAIGLIDREMVNRWVRDLILVKTFVGLRFQEAILAEVAGKIGTSYRLAEPEEESKGIDGFIGKTPVSIKPMTYESKDMLPESIDATLIRYEKKDNDLMIEYDETKL
jgi:hypothetical protein